MTLQYGLRRLVPLLWNIAFATDDETPTGTLTAAALVRAAEAIQKGIQKGMKWEELALVLDEAIRAVADAKAPVTR